MNSNNKGSLVCVGTGIMMGAHITPISRQYIEKADVVFMSVTSHLTEAWIREMNSDVRNLQHFYSESFSRNKTYSQMVVAIVEEVKIGKNVCLALYGHPGVFALVAHKAIEELRQDGIYAKMEPGISAEDCLYADLGIDPGKFGCQQYEATQFMIYSRQVDSSAYLILWQISVAGDLSFTKNSSNLDNLSILVELLSKWYPLDHQVIVYEAQTLPVNSKRIETVALKDITKLELNGHSTLVIPPARELEINKSVENRLK
ncbi:MAG: SAM-dependent methyltransferase [Kangiellaceae bacterium]|nr:SAM-dependent methyltransferase [Kangiellaceae bacterium]MCW8997908.1 SAM-dependent methyltransferase [Kangiellaceae bacterium]